MVAMYRRYLPDDPASDGFADFITSLSEDEWRVLVANIPGPIAEREPYTFSDFDGVTVADFETILGRN